MSGPTREWEASFDWLTDASTAPAAAKGFALWDKGRQKETTGPRVHANLRVPRLHQVSFTFRTKALVFGAALAPSAADPELPVTTASPPSMGTAPSLCLPSLLPTPPFARLW